VSLLFKLRGAEPSAKLSIMERVATIVHPHVEPWEFDALQFNAGWSMDIELIAGEAVVVSPEGGASSAARGELYLALRRWQEETTDEGLVLQDVFVAFPDGSRPAPDISWWTAHQRPPVSTGAMQTVPDLVVEVISPSTRANDEGIKRELYMHSGVHELWLVDPDARTIAGVCPDAGDKLLREGESLTSDLLPGFSVPVARVFRSQPPR
jgi:Uma2 family endonuclease